VTKTKHFNKKSEIGKLILWGGEKPNEWEVF
jgi:hypothetical protein